MPMVNVNIFAIKHQLMNFLSQSDDTEQLKILCQYVPSLGVSVVELRYRKVDDTIIIVMKERFWVIVTNRDTTDDTFLQFAKEIQQKYRRGNL